ncbi:uncharacterized protein LOC119094821 [Pollicipes pollicipes]|uniref:uncharacterized protein LOC119094821 n=1 Tax=Pollicipes pollicipes TaxID=41117 RepID=UPI001884F2CB|nr:uncharacterized protein LOC119094821 [Pollicipes pollicipes]
MCRQVLMTDPRDGGISAEDAALAGQDLMVSVEEMENGEIGMDVLTAAPGIDPASSMHSPVRRSRWCESCAKMIVRDFARHKREVHGEAKPLPCDLCGSVFKYKRSLQVHVKRKHDISWDNYRQVVDGTNSSSRLCSCSRTCRGLKLHISNGFGRRRRCPAH